MGTTQTDIAEEDGGGELDAREFQELEAEGGQKIDSLEDLQTGMLHLGEPSEFCFRAPEMKTINLCCFKTLHLKICMSEKKKADFLRKSPQLRFPE